MAINIQSTKHQIHHVNCMVYAPAGMGKTVLCATAPKPIIISAEGGLLSLSDLSKPWFPPGMKDLPYIEVGTVKEVNDVYDWLTKSKEADQFETVCVDSISELAQKLLVEEKSQNKDGRAAYGIMAELMLLTLRGFRDLPKHTVFIAKMRKLVDESSGVTSFIPSFPGQILPAEVPYLFDEVLRMDIMKSGKEKFRVLHTVGDRRYDAKDRSGNLDPVEEPDLTKLFAKCLGKPIEPENANEQTKANSSKKESKNGATTK